MMRIRNGKASISVQRTGGITASVWRRGLWRIGKLTAKLCLALALLLTGQELFVSPPQLGAAGSVTIYPSPAGLPAAYTSADYTVTAAGSAVPLYNAGNNSWGNRVSYGSFDMDGSVSVSITPSGSFSSYKLVPQSLGLASTRSGNTITFTLNEPTNVTLVLDGNYQGKVLHLFAQAPESGIPDPSDPDVVFFGPGYHDLGGPGAKPVFLESGQTLYLAGGAVLRGRVRANDVTDVTIRGRGILLNDYVANDVDGNVTLAIQFASDVTVRDIIVNNNTDHWTAAMHGSSFVEVLDYKGISPKYASSDGFNINSSHDVLFDGIFIRSTDDTIAVKGLSHEAEPSLAPPVYNIMYKNAQLWSDANNAIGIGAETMASSFSNITFDNIDVLYNYDDLHHPDVLPDRSAINIFALQGTYFHDILFQNIRVEKAKRLINIQMDTSFYFGSITGDWSTPGRISGITYRNITSYSDGTNEIKLSGWDATHDISDVLFDNVVINGSPVTNLNDAWFTIGNHVSDLTIKSAAGTTASRHHALEGFSTTQGTNGWRYRTRTAAGAVYDMSWNPDGSQQWRGSDVYDGIWRGGNSLYLHPDGGKQVSLEWTAPFSGTVRVQGTVKKGATTGGDGIRAAIWKNNSVAWPASGSWQTVAYNDTVGASHDQLVQVNVGDTLSFRVDQNVNTAYDTTVWTPRIDYVFGKVYKAAWDITNQQGIKNWYYRVWRSGVGTAEMAWNPDDSHQWRGPFAYDSIRSGPNFLYIHPDQSQILLDWEAPRAGSVTVNGTVRKGSTGGGDGVDVSIWKNNTMIWPQNGSWQTIAYNDATGYSHQLTFTVAVGDVISFRVDQRGNSAYDTTVWNPVISY